MTPGVVTLCGGDRAGGHAIAEFLGRIQQGTDLSQAGLGEVGDHLATRASHSLRAQPGAS
jgi:hypothetical protein